ncbi:MAG: carboxypeptidase M32 [Candidatus Promineifilaceae bacterium]|nr:carboxypeptidase M32 [Candidatus Promineifilaceae bacterium]
MAEQDKLKELKERLREVDDLRMAAAVLNWDQSTYMPPGGATARGRQLATLGRLAQEKFTDKEIGRLLDELQPWAEERPYTSDEASLIRVTRRQYERATKVPPAFTSEFYNHIAQSYSAWVQARPEDDFDAMRPYLEKTVDLSRQLADFFPGYDHIADPLIDFSDYGMKVETLRPLFADLRRQLIPLVEAIAEQEPIDDDPLYRHYPEDDQLAFGQDVIARYGYDFDRGRQDKTAHPFMTKFSLGDVRITTRVKEDDLREALFSTLHEAGHALYEQGISRDLEATPLSSGTSAGVHESQSRLWENLVGRSRSFWEHFYPQLQETFPDQLGDVSLGAFYRAVNKVERSLIRTDADEVTYNLHVMIRFDLELDLLEGDLAVRELPEAWDARYESDLGLHPPGDRDGVLQDVHWYSGTVGGAFQGYTLGNVMAPLFFDEARAAHPQIDEEMARGEFDTLRGWLQENVYRHGSKLTAAELVERVTGHPLSIDPYVNYLHDKFGDIYDL